MPCCASPPSTFCQEKVTTSSFVQSRSCAKAAEVASQSVSPSRSAGIQFAIRNADAGGRAIPGKDDVVLEIDLGEIGQRAIGRLQDARTGDLELLCDVRRPVLAEALPDEHIHAARAEHGPHGHFESAGVGGRDDADEIIVRHAQNGARLIDGKLELGFSGLGPVRPAKIGIFQIFEGIAGALCAGARRKMRHNGGAQQALEPS